MCNECPKYEVCAFVGGYNKESATEKAQEHYDNSCLNHGSHCQINQIQLNFLNGNLEHKIK